VVLAGAAGGAEPVMPVRLAERVGLPVGLSLPTGPAGMAAGYRQADQAAEAAQHTGKAVVRFAELAGYDLFRLLSEPAATAVAESLLAPLRAADEQGRGDLVESLRCWLSVHGQWDPAAARLGVHRHTLRNRIHRVEQLLGRDLDSPGFRAELWFALLLGDAVKRITDEQADDNVDSGNGIL
jgi:purine catabolism regulator